MEIIYAVVARGTMVLSEFISVTGFHRAADPREGSPPRRDSWLCFLQDRYIFHILRSDEVLLTGVVVLILYIVKPAACEGITLPNFRS